MKGRTRARRRALELLFESEARSIPIAELIELRSHDPEYPMKEYAVEIVNGVTAHQDELDELISTYSRGRTLDRLPAVDRALLRVALWEMLYNDDVDDLVAIDEVIKLAKTYSTDDSPAFLNALLDSVRKIKHTL